MEVFPTKVRGGGNVTQQAAELPDTATVTVVANDKARFDVTPQQEAELADAMDEADRGDLVPAAELLAQLRQ